jgi:Ser/Thr protein kinase RdoA (MazF antagonist)
MAEGARYRLPDEALLKALQAWDIPRVVALEELLGGFTSDTWRLQLSDNSFLVAKFTYDAEAVFESQLRMTEFLHGRGLPVARPLRTPDNRLCVMVEGPPGKHHPLGVMTYLPGEPVTTFSAPIQREAGRLLADIHRTMFEADFVSRDPRFFYEYLESETSPIAYEDWVRPITREVLAEVRSFEAEHDVTRGIILGDDFQLIHDAETGSFGVVDLGHSIWGPVAADVAIMQLWFRKTVPPEPFIDSYFNHSFATAKDREAIPVYSRMRLAGLLKFFAWRVLHASGYDEKAREANERSVQELREALERRDA